MKNKFVLLFLLIVMSSSSCSDKRLLSEYEISVIEYFKEVALGFELGNATHITRKWETEMKIFVGGSGSAELLAELDSVVSEINELATDGFNVKIVNDILESNYYIFLGSAAKYVEIYPEQSDNVSANWGLFNVSWNNNKIISGHMYVDIERSNLTEQKHLLREELTQSLGIGKDSPLYDDSIFQSAWTATTEYAPIDKEVIRLLYHPDMSVGLNDKEVDEVLTEILVSEL